MSELQRKIAGQLHELVTSMSQPDQLAEAFCELDAYGQAQFFENVARIAASWGEDRCRYQVVAIGSRIQKLGTTAARAFVRDLHAATEEP